jgi:hypothetical protein
VHASAYHTVGPVPKLIIGEVHTVLVEEL